MVCSCLTLTIFTKISLLERTSLWTIFEIKTKALLSGQHFVIYSTQESNIILVCCSYCLWHFSQKKSTTAAYLYLKFHKSNNIMTQLQCKARALRKKWASFTSRIEPTYVEHWDLSKTSMTSNRRKERKDWTNICRINVVNRTLRTRIEH